MAIIVGRAKQSILEHPLLMRLVSKNQHCILGGIVKFSDTIKDLDPKAVITITSPILLTYLDCAEGR